MFTGIVNGLGTVVELAPGTAPGITRLVVDAHGVADDLAIGGSLAVNGVCLTSIDDPAHPGMFVAELMGETMDRTSLGQIATGDVVNLERCVPADGRLDGHIVQGHVDAAGRVLSITPQGRWTTLRVSVPTRLAPQIAEKGAIAVDGVSLTVTAVSEPGAAQSWFETGLIPTTLTETRLGRLTEGDLVNIETDVFAKYVNRLMVFAPTGDHE
ncbi:riboflavin synthase [Propionibacterium australiense]|uniref:Riboflavin synthase n=1 Tax=Propionibacterium australiense TaxID=119981 RepID=A0A383S2P2_9ACTN|nr:riboflavin synthase [Propionibacterium australiense]RLP11437.1 riboflavin synthase [Propionibacterium australiense]RLP12827.1 riboflavin synthase [Propionibacterium australiense]SYZ32133.1 riboflavin synthase [Propionibacterium australiense]VEH90832.1 Riboflavin synthase alpha chain [Propionibacterium australiense]